MGSRLEDGGHPDRQVLQLIQKGQGTRKDEGYCPGKKSREEKNKFINDVTQKVEEIGLLVMSGQGIVP